MTLATRLALSILVDVVLFPVKVVLAGGALLVSAVASLPGALAALGRGREGGSEKVERAGGEMACTAGDPAALDEPLHMGDACAGSVCGDAGTATFNRAAFTMSRNRCPGCYRRLFPEVDA